MAFGIANNVKSRVRECTPELFHQVLRSERTAKICAEIQDALEQEKRGEMSREDFETLKSERKKQLAVFTPHATFREGRRVNAGAIPSGLSMYDIDHISDPRGYFDNIIRERVVELGIPFAHITPSLEGLRLFFVMPGGMTLEQAQKWMSEQLGDENYDGCVKDYARSSFVVPESYVLYLDEEELFAERKVEMPAEAEVTTMPVASDVDGDNDNMELAFKEVPYSSIIAQWFQLMGGEPQQGERNDKLHRLASHLRYITDNSDELMLRVMPRYGLSEQEMRQLIRSACQSKWCSMPKMMQRAINLARKTLQADELPEDMRVAPEMPRRLPRLIQLLLSKTPDVYRPAVAHAVFPSLAVHLWKVRFRYIDNVCHEATLMNVLMAGTGAGKDCISEPINHIMHDIRLRDDENLRREAEWKKQVNSRGANKDKQQRPEGLIIQEIDADVTNAAFVQRMAEADEHFLYVKLNEIDQFDALRGNGSRGGQQFQIMCLAFDPGNRYGQTRVGTQSVTEKVTIRFNWNAATTIQKGQRYFSRVLTDGPISRINFCTIPEREIGADMPVYGTYDSAFDEELRPYIERLTRASGEVECQGAYRLARRLKDECAEFARLSQSRVYENLSFRANVIAYLKACVLYVAGGYKWDKTIEDFIRWSLRYDLWCKMQFFGEAIEQASREGERETRPGVRNLLELLPDEFTLHDAELIRQSQGMQTRGTRDMLYQWVHRGYVERIGGEASDNLTTDNYNQVKYRKLKFRSNNGVNTK